MLTSSPGVVRRPRLHDRITAVRLVVLEAPSGFGKSTLLRDWALERRDVGDAMVWVSLVEPLATPLEFWRSVTRAAAADGLIDDEVTVLARLGAGLDAVETLREEWLGRSLTVVLDAFEHAGHLAVSPDLLRLAAELPSLKMVVATRCTPLLTDPVVRLQHGIDLVTADDLALDLEAVAELLERVGRRDRSEAEALHRDTGGYPLAVRVYLLGDVHVGGYAQVEGVHARVAEAMLATIPPAQRDFMVATAAAPFFDVELASLMTGAVDAEATLATLAEQGLGRWLPFGFARPVFQFPDAIRAILRAVALREPANYTRRAGHVADWLLDLGEFEAAVRAAIVARRFDVASVAVARLLLANPVAYTSAMLAPALRSVPPQDLARFPVLALGQAIALHSDPATRGASFAYFRIAARARATDPGVDAGPHSLGVVKVVSQRYLGQWQQAAETARRTLPVLYDLPTSRQPGPLWREGIATALRQFSLSLLHDGDVDHACQLGAASLAECERPWSVNQSHSWAGGIHAVVGRCHEGEAFLAAIDDANWPRSQQVSYANGLGKIGRAQLLLDDFKFDQALAQYDDCPAILTSEFWPFIAATRLAAALGGGDGLAEARRVAETLESRTPRPGVGDNLGTAALRNMLAIAWLASGRQKQAAGLLARPVRQQAQLAPAVLLTGLLAGDAAGVLARLPAVARWRGHTIRSRAAVATIGAAAALRCGQPAQAVDLLAEAASLFEIYGVRAHLALLPATDLAAMRVLGSANPATADLLTVPVDGLDYPEVVSLSERERAVMEALIVHRTREEVASALHVSVNTVKVHMRTAYRKLGASTREHAIERYLALGGLQETLPGS